MKTFIFQLRTFEFEGRIFISLGIVLVVCLIAFTGFPNVPSLMVILGEWLGLETRIVMKAGFALVAGLMVLATLLRMWAGTVLSSPRVMAFKIQKDYLAVTGPYRISRNPIYLADLIAFCGFSLCLNPAGLAMPVLLYIHYIQLIVYEERNLGSQFGKAFDRYFAETPRLLPGYKSMSRIRIALSEFAINRDGFRHNALYLLFVAGFIVAVLNGSLLWAVLIGLPAVADWAFVHTRIGTRPEQTAATGIVQGTKKREMAGSKVFEDIIYAQCWEDPQIDRIAFDIKPGDVVFSITSGGCNVLAFLLDDPDKVIALDLNPTQNYLLDLKINAFKYLGYDEVLEFMGVVPTTRRLEMYLTLRPFLKPESVFFWDNQTGKIASGIIHCGRYEHYMHLLKKWFRLLAGKNLPEKLFALDSFKDRADLYEKKWNNCRWKLFTRIFLSRKVMSFLFTHTFFDQLDRSFSFGEHFRSNIRRAVVELPLKENYFLSYILLGRYYDQEHLPVYLRKENFEKIRSRLDRIEIYTGSCEAYYKNIPDNSISKFNYSNIFEWMDPDAFRNLLAETVRVGRNGAILTYRNLLVPRSRPISMAGSILPHEEIAHRLYQQDLSFIYNAYVVESISKTNGIQSTNSDQ